MKCNRDTSSKATSLLKLIMSFDFIVALVITRCVFDLTLPVTQLLQSNDIADGLHLIESLKNLSTSIRNSIDTYHTKWCAKALTLAYKVDVDERKPRTCGCQMNRDNVPAESASDYLKKVLTIPLADHLHSELKNRFDRTSTNAYHGLYIIPAKMIWSLPHPGKLNWKDNFSLFSSFYLEDLTNPLALDGEVELWEKYWKTKNTCRPDHISSTLKSINFPGFENIKILLRILATLPVTSCECERSFSALRRLKNYNRSTMVANRLNGLALLHVHQEIYPDVQRVIDVFASDKRIELL